MFQLPEIHEADGGLQVANVKGWAKNWGSGQRMGGVWAKTEKAGKECMFVGKGVISLGKENLKLMILLTPPCGVAINTVVDLNKLAGESPR